MLPSLVTLLPIAFVAFVIVLSLVLIPIGVFVLYRKLREGDHKPIIK